MQDIAAISDLAIAGLALDIAGALILGWSLSTKSPKELRDENPTSLSAPTTWGSIFVRFPQGMVRSLIRQRAEARWGLTLLCLGFALQSATYWVSNQDPIDTTGEREFAIAIVAAIWMTAWLGMHTFVPWQERRMHAALNAHDSATSEPEESAPSSREPA